MQLKLPDSTLLGRSPSIRNGWVRGKGKKETFCYRDCASSADRNGYEPGHTYSWFRPARCASGGGPHRFDSQPPDQLATCDWPCCSHDLCARHLWLGFRYWRIDLFALDAARSSRRRTSAPYQPDERCRSSV